MHQAKPSLDFLGITLVKLMGYNHQYPYKSVAYVIVLLNQSN